MASPYKEFTDDELVALLKADDERAFAALYARYWDKLLYSAAVRLDLPEEAEEVVQDIFVSLWRRRHELVLQHQLSTYLSVAVKYQVINIMDKQYRQSQKQEAFVISLDHAAVTPSNEELLLERELKAHIEATICALPEKCRIVFRMSREEGKSNKQIASELDITESTVEKHISKALKDIRGNLAIALPAILILLGGKN